MRSSEGVVDREGIRAALVSVRENLTEDGVADRAGSLVSQTVRGLPPLLDEAPPRNAPGRGSSSREGSPGPPGDASGRVGLGLARSDGPELSAEKHAARGPLPSPTTRERSSSSRIDPGP